MLFNPPSTQNFIGERLKMCKKIENINIFDKGSIRIYDCDICNHEELAEYVVKTGSNNNTRSVVDNKLNENKQYKDSQIKKTPPATLKYKDTNSAKLQNKVNEEIQKHGVILHTDQVLYHGGLFNIKDKTNPKRTLSTTLNPEVALAECYHKGKAYKEGEVNINILTIKDDDIKAIVFNNRIKMSHEREILLEQDLEFVTKCKKQYGTTKFAAVKDTTNMVEKEVPVYITKIEVYKSKTN